MRSFVSCMPSLCPCLPGSALWACAAVAYTTTCFSNCPPPHHLRPQRRRCPNRSAWPARPIGLRWWWWWRRRLFSPPQRLERRAAGAVTPPTPPPSGRSGWSKTCCRRSHCVEVQPLLLLNLVLLLQLSIRLRPGAARLQLLWLPWPPPAIAPPRQATSAWTRVCRPTKASGISYLAFHPWPPLLGPRPTVRPPPPQLPPLPVSPSRTLNWVLVLQSDTAPPLRLPTWRRTSGSCPKNGRATTRPSAPSWTTWCPCCPTAGSWWTSPTWPWVLPYGDATHSSSPDGLLGSWWRLLSWAPGHGLGAYSEKQKQRTLAKMEDCWDAIKAMNVIEKKTHKTLLCIWIIIQLWLFENV